MDRDAAKRFDDLDAAHGWLSDTFAEWEAALTDAERVALAEYKRTGYRAINEALRLGELEGSGVEGLVADLDVALARMRLPEPVITWRGSIEDDLHAALETLPGDIIEDIGFVSASLLRRIAEGFIGDETYSALLVEIAIPGGAAAGAFTGAPDLVADLGEAELLLPRGSQFLVTGSDRGESVLYLEVIP